MTLAGGGFWGGWAEVRGHRVVSGGLLEGGALPVLILAVADAGDSLGIGRLVSVPTVPLCQHVGVRAARVSQGLAKPP